MTFILYDFLNSLLNTENIIAGGIKIKKRTTARKRTKTRRKKIKDTMTEKLAEQNNIMGGMEIENIETGKVTEYKNKKRKYPEYFLFLALSSIYAWMQSNSYANYKTMVKIPFQESFKTSHELIQKLMEYCGEKNDKCAFLVREIYKTGYTNWFVNLMDNAEFEIENQFNERLPEPAKKLIKQYIPTILNQVQLFLDPSDKMKINDSKLYRPKQLLITSQENTSSGNLSILETVNENVQNMYDELTYYVTGENIGQTQQFHVEEMIRNSVRRVCEQTENRLRRTYEISNEERNSGYSIILTVLVMYMMVKVFLKLSSKIAQTKKIKAQESTAIVSY